MHETDEVAPLVAVLDGGNRTLPLERPDPSQERFQADTMLIYRPELNFLPGETPRPPRSRGVEVFLTAAAILALGYLRAVRESISGRLG